VVGLDPSPRLLAKSKPAATTIARPVALLQASAEAIPLDGQSVDTVVTTWTLCTIPDVDAALREMRRVLSPHGRLLFVEHGRAPDETVHRWQNRLTPLWKRIGGGCHLNRPICELIERAGFRIEQLDTGYMKGPKPMTFMYEGCARPAERP
jgi:ubiquinone/menaquinone biosynthesis C-methylase UbiE